MKRQRPKMIRKPAISLLWSHLIRMRYKDHLPSPACPSAVPRGCFWTQRPANGRVHRSGRARAGGGGGLELGGARSRGGGESPQGRKIQFRDLRLGSPPHPWRAERWAIRSMERGRRGACITNDPKLFVGGRFGSSR